MGCLERVWKHRRFFTTSFAVVAAVPWLAGCPNPEQDTQTYFEQRIKPILDENCVSGTADNKCHVEAVDENGDGLGLAMGNYDLSTYEGVVKRRDMLEPYGAYPHPILLMKGANPADLKVNYSGVQHDSEIFHAGGGILSVNSEAFVELQTWLKNGATQDGQPVDSDGADGVGECVNVTRPDVLPFLDQATGGGYDRFVDEVQPILLDGCGMATCHGNPEADFYIACGDDEDELRHNYIISRSFIADETARSELLLRPLAGSAGGMGHTGGENWSSSEDPNYVVVRDWAEEDGPLDLPEAGPEFEYFADEVMPVLLRRGCAMPQCHSAHGFNDFRLRAGSRGFFSPLAVQRNYKETRSFINVDTAIANRSRILAKNVADDIGGVVHRAGIVLLENRDEGGDPAVCDAQADTEEGRSAYCTIVEWIRLEREASLAAGLVSPQAEADSLPIFYIDRPATSDTLFEFSNFRGDSRLMRVDAGFDAEGQLADFSAPTEVDLSDCASFSPEELDVRGPEINYEGDRLVFALRAGEDDGLNVYASDLDGGNCEALTGDGGGTDSGVPIHNFDPVFIPADEDWNPGGSIVFASTRPGKLGRANVSPKNRLPASNIWRMKLDGSELEQMTFLNGSEISPAVMVKGRVTMSTEKATESFYQVSGRRINWDLTDYHPLLASRETIGYRQSTEIREGFDRNFIAIYSDPDARFGGGTLATFNRSVGPFEEGRDDPIFIPSLDILDPDAEGAGQGPANGAYRSPFQSPDGRILVSYAPGELDLNDADADVDYGLALIDPVTAERTEIDGTFADGRFQIEAIIGYKRRPHKLFLNSPSLSFGGVVMPDVGDRAWAHFLDLPLLATMLTDNLRHGRDVETMDHGDTIAAYLAHPPPVGDTADGGTFQDWELVGEAPLADDGSAFIDVPAGVPVVLELRDGDTPLLTMTEEFQFGPGEMLNFGVKRDIFNGICGGCHGSISGRELDIVVNEDALTSATVSLSRPTPDDTPTVAFNP